MNKQKNNKLQGAVLVTTLVFITIIGILIISLTSYYIYDQSLTKRQIFQNQAMYLAMSGINYYEKNSSTITTTPVTIKVPATGNDTIVITKISATDVRVAVTVYFPRSATRIAAQYNIKWNGSKWTKL